MSSAERSRPVLELDGITKRFGSVTANEDVTFDLRAGEIHALVGENGAGKTTLMRILYGMYSRDGGTIRVDGQAVDFRKPADSIGHGIGMVHQHFMLVPSFTVAENLTLGAEPGGRGRYRRKAAEEAVRSPMQRLGVQFDPSLKAGSLSVARQQQVEIMKVLYRGARIIILDEPTAVLTPQETEELFRLLRRLADGGDSIIFISHKLREVFAIADRITVLRQGRTISTHECASTTPGEIVAHMTGREGVNLGRVEREATAAGVVLRAADLSTAARGHDAALDRVSLEVRSGEIVGIAGVEGNGQSVLAEALMGTTPLAQGRIELNGLDITDRTVAHRRDLGLAYVPEDRHLQGVPINGTVIEGLAAGRIRKMPRGKALGLAFPHALRSWVGDMITKYGIRTRDADAHCGTLSGGNQQKVVIARELEEEPDCLLLCQPTRGVDLGAIESIYFQIAKATTRGCAVLLVSADLDEIFRLADRVLVMFDGRVVADVRVEETTREELGMYMMGTHGDGVAA
ncbi:MULTISPECIES: ABC transporter ATP-binding protein [unclassified Nocardioides]|uniref:ABC transporter ATP-binding protein n=1 Tax=unclassified Nocardioides TaxID=2615069 RepID=UPI0000570B22|nr:MULTISPECIES: ABC transporter ATP-binding protein [unclassified Nocardioides]ABL83691.1 nucleoside ABC transporter ATP-binding protein [Nocardioides sp. JS614]